MMAALRNFPSQTLAHALCAFLLPAGKEVDVAAGLKLPCWTVKQLNARKTGRTRYKVQGFPIHLELPTPRFSKKTNTLLLATKTIPNY